MNNERAELICALNSEAELLSQMGYCGAPKLMREAAALLAADAQGGEAVASIHVSRHKAGENFDVDYWGDLSPGSHLLYTRPQPQAVTQGWKLYGNRQDFERYASEQGYRDFEQNEFSDYKNSHTQARWNFWRAGQDAMLAASPAAPQAVPLTDEQIKELVTWGCSGVEPHHLIEFARAIEQAHGIKEAR